MALLLTLSCATANAGKVVVVDAAATCEARSCHFEVTLRHDDSGWDHYADQWRVLDTRGNVLGKRELLHPHVDEQPFTRSLSNVSIPVDVSTVVIEGRDTVHGVSDHTLTLELDL
ncbi:MAG: hypothetical protein DWQ08_03000 [Proteobacteria bacterium]|nr:MAG: hypothetical protein DWQ08_03000 [Pseudomonadota bacterium]